MKSVIQTPISVKLVLVTIALVSAVVVPVAFRSSDLFESTFRKSQFDANAEISNSKATEVEGLLLNFLDKVRSVTDLIIENSNSGTEHMRSTDALSGALPGALSGTLSGTLSTEALERSFHRDLDIVNIDIFQIDQGVPRLFKRLTNKVYLEKFGLDEKHITRIRQERPFVDQLFKEPEHIIVRNATLANSAPLFSIGVPFMDASGVVTHVAIADIRLDRLQRAFTLGSNLRTVYLVDRNGEILAHSNDQLAIEKSDESQVPIVADALTQGDKASKGQKRFFDPITRQWWMGAYSRTSFGITVITQAPERLVLEPAQLVRYEAFRVAGYVFSGALFLIILFSMSLTRPIEALHEATLQVADGNLDVRAEVSTRDEVGELASSFNVMVDGLRERDKIKNILHKFHGSSVSEDLIKNDLKLGGHRRIVTVFFSDIRDFTKYSETHTPEEVVEMLNEYFHIMIGIIVANHGIVDKFVGDAIMAVWGAPQSTGEDCVCAVRASLEMRMALNELNQQRLARGQSAIKIGMGLHHGPAISGKMGSTERMEYTVIGDTVNMASRIEASTKAFGADLLISQAVVDQLQGRFLIEVAGSAEVKGKSEAIQMFRVTGQVQENGEPQIIATPYSSYEPGHVDKVKAA